MTLKENIMKYKMKKLGVGVWQQPKSGGGSGGLFPSSCGSGYGHVARLLDSNPSFFHRV
jgi:hypothetical protein